MKKIVMMIVVSVFCATLWAAASTNDAPAVSKIRFGTEATYPPFEFVNEQGQITGFDIDIAKALCTEIKAQCTFNTQSFDSLIPSLKLGKFDALIASIGITPERLKQVAFTNPYYQPSASFVAKTANHYTVTDLAGKTIGVQSGTTFENYLQDKYSSVVTIKTYASIQDAFLDLQSGRVDMVLADTPIAQQWLHQNTNSNIFGIIDKPIEDETYFGSGYGIAVKKNNTALLTALNNALTTIKANGQYAAIEKKYGLGKT